MVIGDSGVGKSSIILRFVKNQFKESLSSTIGLDYCNKDLKILDKKLRL